MPLTAIGIKQAQEASEKIKQSGIAFDLVFASPLQRVFKTAEIICSTLHINPPIAEEILIERDFGVMTGQPVTSILERCLPDVLQTDHINFFLHPEGSESFPDLMKRARVLIDRLDAEYENKNILLATHGDMGQMIYAQYYHLDWENVLKSFHFGNSELLLLSEKSPADEAHVFKIQQHNVSK